MSDTDATQARQDVVADVDEILEHVINGNSLSMPYDVYVELFDAVDGLGVEIEKLQAENAKLKEELEAVGTAAYLYGRSDLKIENAKLRELVRGLVYATHPADRARLIADAVELGVEVE